MIKKSLLYVFPVGIMFYLMGAVFIERSNKSSRDAINEAGRRAKENGTRYFKIFQAHEELWKWSIGA